MPRSGGNYTLPEPAFIPSTPISSSAVNSDLDDIADALTGSLARDGQGGMTAVLPMANAGFNYLTDPNTGIRRSGADTQAIFCGGLDIVEIATTGETVNGNQTVTGNLYVTGEIFRDGNTIIPIGLGPLPWTGLTPPPLWVLANGQSLLRAAYPDLWAFAQAQIAGGNNVFYTNGNGSTTFTVGDATGRVIAGREAVASRLTSTYFGGNSTFIGSTGGLESNLLTVAQLAAHSHGISDPGHTHPYTAPNVASTFAGGVGSGSSFVTLNTGSAFTGITIFNAGSSDPHPNVQPTIICSTIIFAGA